MEKSVKTNLEIQGVHLSDELIDRLKTLQQHDNESIRNCREHIADAICFIGKNMDTVEPEDMRKIQNLITDLSFIRDYFNDFRKP